MIKEIIKALVRARNPVRVADLPLRMEPLSRIFGLERGTPIDRFYIERFLASHADQIKGDVLEIGEARYARQYGEKVTRSHVLHAVAGNPSATIVGDLTNLSTLPEGLADCFICTQTFNFIYDVSAAIRGAHHILKPGGVLLATVSGLSQVSRYDMDRWGDYWRFTTASIQKLFTDHFTGQIQLESHGNVFAATGLLQGIVVEDLPSSELLTQNDRDYQVIITIVACKADSKQIE